MTTDKAYLELLARARAGEKLTALEFAIIGCGHGKSAYRAAQELADLKQASADLDAALSKAGAIIADLRRELVEKP